MNNNQTKPQIEEVDEDYLEYLWELEKEHRGIAKQLNQEINKNWKLYFLSDFSNQQLRHLFETKIAEWKELQTNARLEVRGLIKQFSNLDDPLQKLSLEIQAIPIEKEYANAEKQIMRLKVLVAQVSDAPQIKTKYLSEVDIDNAKQVSIERIVGAYLDLKRAGSGKFVGLCPFHQEKTPSFFIFENTNNYKCFGCQEGGDTIQFIKLVCNLSFRGAVNHILSNFL